MTPTFEPIGMLAELSTEQILLSGGDTRLAIDAKTGFNKYGCGSHPDPTLIAFGSSTGSTISERGFDAAHALHQRLLNQENLLPEAAIYRNELERIRNELKAACGISDHNATASIFAASGTDLHLICSQLLAAASGTLEPLHVIMMDACETGSGVAPAVRGQHFSANAALGGKVTAFETLQGAYPVQVSNVGLRALDGSRRPMKDIDDEVHHLIRSALTNNQRVLLIMIDVSKTGLIAPSPRCVADLRRDFPDKVDVLVDACQFRISGSTLNAYLKAGCLVALTGSKFLTGPVFSGVLQVPANLISRLSRQYLPVALADYSARAEWPLHWQATLQLSDRVNWGLLLRLEAALAELKAFRTIPDSHVREFLSQFARAMRTAISASPHFELIAETDLSRSPLCPDSGWDRIPTIFPFLLLHQPGTPLSRTQTQQIYQQLQLALQPEPESTMDPTLAALRCQLGQPVLCGTRYGVDVSALRICASSRLIIEACMQDAASADRVIQRALQVLHKTEGLIRNL